MTPSTSASVYQKPTLQEQKEPESTAGTPAKFNNLQVKVVSEASIQGIRKWLDQLRADAVNIRIEKGNAVASSLPISEVNNFEANTLASTHTPLPDDNQSKLDPERESCQKLMGYHSVSSTSLPPLEFVNMKKIEIPYNFIMFRDMLKYHLNADGLLEKEEYTGSDNTVKQVAGVYVFNDIDKEFRGQFRPHRNSGLSDTHSIHAGEFDDGTFFLLALRKELYENFFVFDPFDSKKIGYFGDSYAACGSGDNTHSLYCGKTYEEAVETFEQACEGTLVATNIRRLLGFQSDSERKIFQKLMSLHDVSSTSLPPLEFRNMKKIEIQRNCIMYRDMLKYHLNADGLLENEEYTGSDNTVKQVTGVYVFNDIDEDYKGQYRHRPHRNRGLSDTHSIHAGQFDDGTFFLLALRKELCKRFLEFDRFDSKKIGYSGDSFPACGSGDNTHSLYCGKTYEEAVETFEQACKGTLVATKIRDLLGFQPDSVGTRFEAQKPE